MSIIALGALAAAKAIVGTQLGSIALVADGLHSFSDIFVSATVIFGLIFLTREPTKRFPYGYARVETFASLVAAGFILFSAAGIGYQAIQSLRSPSEVERSLLAIAVAAASAITLLAIAGYKSRVGRAIGSKALMADAKHSLSDVLSSLIVVGGLIGSAIGYPQLEAVAGLIIAAFIVKIGVEVSRDAVLVLLDAWDEPGITEALSEIAEQYPGVRGMHKLRLRKSGPYIFGEMHLEVDPTLSIAQSDQLVTTLKHRFRDEVENIETFTIETEAKRRESACVAVGVEDDTGLDAPVSAHFGECPYFVLAHVELERIDDTAPAVLGEGDGVFEIGSVRVRDIARHETISNPGAALERRRGAVAAQALLDAGAELLLTENIGPGGFYLLREKLVEVRALPTEMVGDAAGGVIARYPDLDTIEDEDIQRSNRQMQQKVT